jgi:hypothetical protein
MKHSDNTEMDRLLRRYGRRGGEALRGAAGEQVRPESNPGSHMDADEMSAYAEGALPEGARSRYFAHLADCDDCRTLVTSLTLAAARNDEDSARVAAIASTPARPWREWLAAIFSPPVMRYGVPALALFVVILVAVVATRRTRDTGTSVAQINEESRYSQQPVAEDSKSAANTAAGTTATTGNQASSNAAPLVEQQTQAQPEATPSAPASQATPFEDKEPVLSQERVAKSSPQQPGEMKDGTFATESKREQVEVTAAPAAAPPNPQPTVLSAPSTTTVASDRDEAGQQRKSKTAGKDDNDALPANGRVSGGVVVNRPQVNEDRADTGSAATARATPLGAARRKAPAASKSSGPSDDKRSEKEGEPETRSVGGRRFERRGGAWVDTSYNSSRPTTNVARGSEQYRALVADEPTLRTIAERLGGEVIVVWKSRAYRFY